MRQRGTTHGTAAAPRSATRTTLRLPVCERGHRGSQRGGCRTISLKISKIPVFCSEISCGCDAGWFVDSPGVVENQYNSLSVPRRESGCVLERIRAVSGRQGTLPTPGGASTGICSEICCGGARYRGIGTFIFNIIPSNFFTIKNRLGSRS